MTQTQTPPVSVDLMRTLDEKHMATSLAFEAMHTAGVFVVDGAPLTQPDGSIDRERVLAAVSQSMGRIPELGKRLMPSPLGLTAPAWVPDQDYDVVQHVHFADGTDDLTPESIKRLAGVNRPPLARNKPLWDMTVTRLNDGDIACGFRLHHVVGDAKWAFDSLTLVTDPDPVPEPMPESTPVRAPRTSLTIPVHAAVAWAHEQPSVRAGWAEYWRKPIVKRAKRMGGRNTRFLKEWMIRRKNLRETYLPPTTVSFFSLDASTSARAAAKLRGSLNDLLVAAAMRAVDDDDLGIDVFVPVSRRTKNDRQIRNHVLLTRVHGAPGAELNELVPEVRRQVVAFSRGTEIDPLPQGRAIGYATIVPWADHRRYLAGAEVRNLVALPASDPRDEFSVFASTYEGVLNVTVAGRAELDVQGCADRLQAILEELAAGRREAA